jgi:hypothetical protein
MNIVRGRTSSGENDAIEINGHDNSYDQKGLNIAVYDPMQAMS